MGACAWLRPEMLAYAIVLAFGRARERARMRNERRVRRLAIGPWFATALLRAIIRDDRRRSLSSPNLRMSRTASPTSSLCFCLRELLLAVCAPLAMMKLRPWVRVLIAGAAVHFTVIVLAGGDSMSTRATRLSRSAVTGARGRRAARSGSSKHRDMGPTGDRMRRRDSVVILAGPRRLAFSTIALSSSTRPARPCSPSRVATIRRRLGRHGNRRRDHRIWPARPIPRSLHCQVGTPPRPFRKPFSARRPDLLVFQLANVGTVAEERFRHARTTEVRVANDPLIRPAYQVRWISPSGLSIRYDILSRN